MPKLKMPKPPGGFFRRFLHRIGSFLLHYLPALIIDGVFIWAGWPAPACSLGKLLRYLFGGAPVTCGA
jgi:hypothetical protein